MSCFHPALFLPQRADPVALGIYIHECFAALDADFTAKMTSFASGIEQAPIDLPSVTPSLLLKWAALVQCIARSAGTGIERSHLDQSIDTLYIHSLNESERVVALQVYRTVFDGNGGLQ